MGSLVLKEESGYRAFFHHLIRPHEHYLPVWKEVSHPDFKHTEKRGCLCLHNIFSTLHLDA